MIIERTRAVAVAAAVVAVLAAATGCASRVVGSETGAGATGIESSATTVTTANSAAGTDAAEATGALTVRVGISGGPMRADGTMALSNSPEPGVHVSATNQAGRRWNAITTEDGTVTLHLPAGRYTVVAGCGNVPQPVTVTAGQAVLAQVQCDVP